MNSILSVIKQKKIAEIKSSKERFSVKDFLSIKQIRRDFVQALTQHDPAIIAEIKQASPSKGIICKNFDVVYIAQTYEKHNAAALSVLTDLEFFKGHSSYIKLAKDNCTLPVLRKDFIIDEFQIYESYYLEADCILLIVALLDDKQLLDYCKLAKELNMAVLVESHSQAELLRAVNLPTPLMGINNRCLNSFKVDINTSINLSHLVPKDKYLIAESGIRTYTDIQYFKEHNINKFLVGEHLLNTKNIGLALDRLLGR